ncbi:hypothetical protein FB451DRAFT_1265092 [Mycena latifolia]|nr:hypothetical protein FB451DRAFT_1265092 [Mycena latifolia]
MNGVLRLSLSLLTALACPRCRRTEFVAGRQTIGSEVRDMGFKGEGEKAGIGPRNVVEVWNENRVSIGEYAVRA